MAGHVIPGLTPVVRTWGEMLSLPYRALGRRPFFVRGWRSDVQRSPEHVDPDRYQHRCGLRHSVVAALAPGLFPRSLESHGRIGVSISRRPPSFFPDPARPDAGNCAPFADFVPIRNRFSAGRPRLPADCARWYGGRCAAQIRFKSAACSSCAESPVDGLSSKVSVPSTNRCSLVSPLPVTKRLGDDRRDHEHFR